MPLFGRKPVGLLPFPENLKPHEELFVVKETNEAFRSYDEYICRHELYKLPVWTCKLTSKTNLSYSDALKSEATARKQLSAIQGWFIKPMLQIIHHNMDRFEDVVDEVYEHIHTIFSVGEPVEIKRNKSDVEEEEAVVVKVVEPKEENPDDLEPEPYFFDVKFKKDGLVKTGVHSDEISRLERAPSKDLVRMLMRDSSMRVGKGDQSAWIVKESLISKYNLQNKISDAPNHITLDAWPTPVKKPPSKSAGDQSKEKSVARVLKGISKVMMSSRKKSTTGAEGKEKKPKKLEGLKQTTLFQLSGKSPKVLKSPGKVGGGDNSVVPIHSIHLMADNMIRANPLPNVKPARLIELLNSKHLDKKSHHYRDLVRAAAISLSAKEMDQLPMEERTKVERKAWLMMSTEERQQAKEEKKKRQKLEREEQKAKLKEMSKILPEEELDLSDQPLHEGMPVFPPEGLEMRHFSDLVMMCEYLWHYGELLFPDESQGRPPTVESLAKALTSGVEGFPLLTSVLVSFLQLLLQDMPSSRKVFNLPLRGCPLSPYTVCEVVRLVFQLYQPQMNDKVKNIQDSDDDDMSSSDESRDGVKTSGDREKRKDEQDSEEEEEREVKKGKTKKDVDDVVTPELLKIVDSLERIEFYDLLPAEKLQVMVALFYKALCSDALDDFIEEKMEKWKELMRDSRADRAEERAQMMEERKKRREEKESAKKQEKQETTETQDKQVTKQDGSIDTEKTDKTEGEDKRVSDGGMVGVDKDLDVLSSRRRRRLTVAEAQAERLRQERLQMEKVEREARELKEQKRVQAEKRKAEQRKEARKDELSRIKNIFRLEPFGFDRHLRRYWIFQSALPGLYIEDGWLSIPQNATKPDSNIGSLTASDEAGQRTFSWWHLPTMEDIDQFMESLTTRGMREHVLKTAIEDSYQSIRESFNSFGWRASTRSKDRDQLQALKENLASIQIQLSRRIPGRAEEMAKFERRLDWAKSLEDLIPLTLETQEAINEACFHGTLLPDPARSGSSSASATAVSKKTKPSQLERWRDAVQQAATFPRLQLLVGILDALIVWKKGLLCIPKAKFKTLPTRRLSLRRGLRQANYKDTQSEDEQEEESAAEEEGSGNQSSIDQESDEEGSEESSGEESDDQSRRVTRKTTRAATKKSYKTKSNAAGSSRVGRTGTKRSWRRIESSSSDEESDSSSNPSSPQPPKQAKKGKQNTAKQTLNARKRSTGRVQTRKRLRAPMRRSRRNTELPTELKECDSILATLIQHEDSWPFRVPVDTMKVPDYEDIVENPMDLSTIQDNLHMHYATADDFTSDMRLIFFNCEVYNEANSEIAVAGRRLEGEFTRLLKERLPNVDYHPVYSDSIVGAPRKKRKTSRK